LPQGSDFPAWSPMTTIAPPRRWYAGKKHMTRCNQIASSMTTGVNAGTIALNRDAYAFGMWVCPDGPTPGAQIALSDIFINLDIEFCDLAPIAIYDATGGSSFSSSVSSLNSNRYDGPVRTQLSSHLESKHGIDVSTPVKAYHGHKKAISDHIKKLDTDNKVKAQYDLERDSNPFRHDVKLISVEGKGDVDHDLDYEKFKAWKLSRFYNDKGDKINEKFDADYDDVPDYVSDTFKVVPKKSNSSKN